MLEQPYLIQRSKFKDRDWKTGIDSILELDYMGSAEFEFGAVPRSLKRIREHIANYGYFDLAIGDHNFTVFCKQSDFAQVGEWIDQLRYNKIRLKERADFATIFSESPWDKNCTDHWWDIDNHYMWWKKNDEFKTKFKQHI